jgi:DNA-binding beta-propeller fold protein YncE
MTMRFRSLLLLAAVVGGAVALGTSAAQAQITFLNSWGGNQLSFPSGVALDQNGNVYVTDEGNSRIVIFDSTGTFQGDFGSEGAASGEFNEPSGLAVGPTGNIYVADFGNNRVQIFNSVGNYQSTIGSTTPGTGAGEFDGPDGVAVGSAGNIYVADTLNNRVQYFNSNGSYQTGIGGPSSGAGNLQFDEPIGITVGPTGNIYVADTLNNRIQIFTPSAAYQGTIGGAAAGTGNGQFDHPEGVAVGSTGNIYVADTLNNRVQVFNSSGVYQSTIGTAGTGVGQFSHPTSVAVAPTGNIYVADASNNRIERFFDPSSWASGTNNFTNPAVGPTSVSVGGSSPLLGNSFTLNSSMELVATTLGVGSGSASPAGSLTISGATVSATNIDINYGTLTQSSGESSASNLSVSGASTQLGLSGGTLSAGAVTVDAAGALTISGGLLSATTISINNSGVAGSLTQSAGSLSAGSLTIGGLFTYHGGAQDFPIMAVNSGGTLTGAPFTVNADEALTLSGGTISSSVLTIDPGGSVAENGGTISSTVLNVGGTFNYTSGTLPPTLFLDQGGIVSGGTITNSSTSQIVGAGTVSSAVTNNGLIEPIDGLMNFTGTVTNAGVIIVSNGNEALFSNLTSNPGTISLAGGTLDTSGTTLTNASQISGYGVLRTGALTNNGTLALAGSSSVFGSVTNGTSGAIHLSGNSPNVFFAAVSNSGTLTIDAGASGTFYGAYTGAGPINNYGSAYFNASSIAGEITGNGNLNVGSQSAPTQLQLMPIAATSIQSSLNLSTGSTLDITSNTLTLNYGAGTDPASTIRAELVSGFNAGGAKWTGTGITSSLAAANPTSFAVGYADGGNPINAANTGVAPGTIEVKYTVAGDANLSGDVDLSDLVIIASDFGQTNADWAEGDVNYDGNVDLSDLVIVASNFGASLSSVQPADFNSSFAAEWKLAQAEVQGTDVGVPEPGAVCLTMVVAAGVLARLRRSEASK